MARTLRRTRPRFPMVTVTVIFLLLIGVGVALGHLLTGGEIPIPFTDPPRTFALKSDDAENSDAPEGKISVPTSGRALKALAAVVPEDLMADRETLRKSVVYLSPEQAKRLEVITDLRKIVGRVLKRDKAQGKVFRESDFAPRGTRPGITAGTPAGKVAQRIDVSRIPSLYGLKQGDRFDLVATLSVGRDSVAQIAKLGGTYGDRLALEARMQNLDKQAVVQVVVRNGLVVQGAKLRMIPVARASVQRGAGVQEKPVEEVVIALGPDEVPFLNQALAVGAEITCLAHSGLAKASEDKGATTSDWNPWRQIGADGSGGGGVAFVETIRGDKKAVEPVPVGRRGEQAREGIVPASFDSDGEKTSDTKSPKKD